MKIYIAEQTGFKQVMLQTKKTGAQSGTRSFITPETKNRICIVIDKMSALIAACLSDDRSEIKTLVVTIAPPTAKEYNIKIIFSQHAIV